MSFTTGLERIKIVWASISVLAGIFFLSVITFETSPFDPARDRYIIGTIISIVTVTLVPFLDLSLKVKITLIWLGLGIGIGVGQIRTPMNWQSVALFLFFVTPPLLFWAAWTTAVWVFRGFSGLQDKNT